MKYKVLAAQFHVDGTPAAPPHWEEIDTETNQLFTRAKSIWDVEDAFEAFWNRINPSYENDPARERVKVLAVVKESK